MLHKKQIINHVPSQHTLRLKENQTYISEALQLKEVQEKKHLRLYRSYVKVEEALDSLNCFELEKGWF